VNNCSISEVESPEMISCICQALAGDKAPVVHSRVPVFREVGPPTDIVCSTAKTNMTRSVAHSITKRIFGYGLWSIYQTVVEESCFRKSVETHPIATTSHAESLRRDVERRRSEKEKKRTPPDLAPVSRSNIDKHTFSKCQHERIYATPCKYESL